MRSLEAIPNSSGGFSGRVAFVASVADVTELCSRCKGQVLQGLAKTPRCALMNVPFQPEGKYFL